jgi:hypothetical protein
MVGTGGAGTPAPGSKGAAMFRLWRGLFKLLTRYISFNNSADLVDFEYTVVSIRSRAVVSVVVAASEDLVGGHLAIPNLEIWLVAVDRST